jgi:hypothetical protein
MTKTIELTPNYPALFAQCLEKARNQGLSLEDGIKRGIEHNTFFGFKPQWDLTNRNLGRSAIVLGTLSYQHCAYGLSRENVVVWAGYRAGRI